MAQRFNAGIECMIKARVRQDERVVLSSLMGLFALEDYLPSAKALGYRRIAT
jgi:hypothetical protein